MTGKGSRVRTQTRVAQGTAVLFVLPTYTVYGDIAQTKQKKKYLYRVGVGTHYNFV